MPCGGIWTPEPGSHWVSDECWVCHKFGCELFCDEWDTPLHIKCLGLFLQTEEGQLMLLNHGHGIMIPEREGTNVSFAPAPDVNALLDAAADEIPAGVPPVVDYEEWTPEQLAELRADYAEWKARRDAKDAAVATLDDVTKANDALQRLVSDHGGTIPEDILHALSALDFALHGKR